VLWHLRKQFGGAGGKLAVRDLCVRIESGEVFGFLGTNGAGKSTTFGMLTGEKVPTPLTMTRTRTPTLTPTPTPTLTPPRTLILTLTLTLTLNPNPNQVPTSGHAFLQGRSILTEQAAIRRFVGYCPQHDALEPLMTCREALRMYARIKGVPRAEIEAPQSVLVWPQ
jgi:ATP-binding cassette subfamily A (ABC1) protein 3